jgi:hypothetical protein
MQEAAALLCHCLINWFPDALLNMSYFVVGLGGVGRRLEIPNGGWIGFGT